MTAAAKPEMTRERLVQMMDEALEAKFGKLEERLTTAHEARVLSFEDALRRRDERKDTKKVDAGITFGRYIMSVAASVSAGRQGNPIKAVDWAKEKYGAESDVCKALSATSFSAGGALIPETLSSEIIPLLRPASAVRQLNPTFVDMPTGKIDIAKVTGGATATYIGENQNIPKTEQTFGQISLVAKKLGALVPISNDLLQRATGADTIARDDTVAALAQRSDLAFIRGAGTQYVPKGLRFLAGPASTNVIAANATVTLDNVTADIKKVLNAIEATDSKMLRPGWIMSPRTKNYLRFVRDANGNFVFKAEIDGGTLIGFPFATTTQIPNNLGGGTDESEVYFADFADIIIGETGTLRIAVSEEASYDDGGLKSAFSLDQTVLRVIQEHDINTRYESGIVVLTGVKWI